MIKKHAIDGSQERWSGTIAELCALPVQTPEIQRDVDPDRVDTIVEYQEARLRASGSFLFLGDLAMLMNDHGQLWIVDGQHRLRAARRLAAVCPDYPVTVLVVSVDAVKLSEAFRLINAAVPVPDWIIAGTLQARQRSMLRSVEAAVRKLYGSFLSNATTPRRPNVSLSALVSALVTAACRHPDVFPDDPDRVITYLKWCNARLRERHPGTATTAAAVEKATKSNVQPLFYGNEPTFEFLSDWLAEFPADDTSAPDEPLRARRQGIPKATRVALWNRTFGERRGVGACFCCKRDITQQSFECGHIVAAARGGTDALENLRPLCATCNRSMGAEDMDAFMQRTGLARIGRDVVAFDPFRGGPTTMY